MKKPTYRKSVLISWVSWLIEILYYAIFPLLISPKSGIAIVVIMCGIGVICMVGTFVFMIKFCRCPHCDRFIIWYEDLCPFCQNYLG